MTEGTTPEGTPREPGDAWRHEQGPPQQPPPAPPGGQGWGQPGGQGWGPSSGQGWGPSGGPQPGQPGTTGMPENTASGLSYIALFLSGAIFFILDRRLEVRFHAMQSILFGAAWVVVGVLRGVLNIFPLNLVLYLVWLAGLVIWVVLLIRGFQGRHFKLPFIGDLAEQQARHTS